MIYALRTDWKPRWGFLFKETRWMFVGLKYNHFSELSSNEGVSHLPCLDEEIRSYMIFVCPFAHPTVMISKEILKKYKYDSDFDGCEDYHLWA